MATKVYGKSDDLVDFDGDVWGEVGCFGTDDSERGVLVVFSDGTMLEVKYGKLGQGIWGINALKRGPLLDRIDLCDDADAEIYSDVAHFRDGLKWAIAATEWGPVR